MHSVSTDELPDTKVVGMAIKLRLLFMDSTVYADSLGW